MKRVSSRTMPEGIQKRVRAGGVVWVARVSETVAGRRMRVSRTFPTLTLARQWRRAKQSEIERGTRLGGSPETLREALDTFLAGAEAGAIRTRTGRAYKPSTLRGYQQAARDVAAGPLGAARIAKITRRDVQTLVDEMVAAGKDASTVRNLLKPLQAVLRRAVEDGLLVVNPTLGLRLPAVEGKRERIATPDEAERLLKVLEPSRERLIWALAFYSGLRLGELRGLRWADVDEPAGVIRVERALDAQGSVIDVKSRAGRRTVPIVARLGQELAETPRKGALVLGDVDDRPPSMSLARAAQRVWAREGLEAIGLHEARHTFASFLIAAGVNAKAISAALGHASIAITLDRYGHLMPGSTGEVRDRLDAYLALADTEGRLRQLED
jgi:integrase